MFFEFKKNFDVFMEVPFNSLHVGDVFVIPDSFDEFIKSNDICIKIPTETLNNGNKVNAISAYDWSIFSMEEDELCYVIDMENPIISYNNIRRLS